MFFSKYILPLPFFISLFIGFLMVYITAPLPEIICKHPTPDNIEKNIYNLNDDTCYKYKAQEVSCPQNKDKITKTPVDYECKKD
jgi:hypothetical protein|uniref:Uncharacterized protein n=1 Tax=Mimiviridae sp. ChoanoV1 TaxID=2596887 RepID=A0A5B8IPU5_9VIRU|nr:hypothetical protein 2_36 [Mimiviridae sp. ChoanoV1]